MPPLRTSRATRQRGGLAALIIAIALAAAACGGASGSASSTSATPTTTSTTASGTASGATSAALAKYTACLKQNGVTLPAGGSRPPAGAAGGTKRPTFPQGGNSKFAKAQSACAKLRPAGLRAGGPTGGNVSSAVFAAYRNCLTLHGVKATALRGGANATPTAATSKAMTACASLRPKQQAPTALAGNS